MARRTLWTCLVLGGLGLALSACEAVVGDFEARSCDPDPPASCADLGDADGQRLGCCDGPAETVWYCVDGGLRELPCGDLTCDYDPDREIMACVE